MSHDAAASLTVASSLRCALAVCLLLSAGALWQPHILSQHEWRAIRKRQSRSALPESRDAFVAHRPQAASDPPPTTDAEEVAELRNKLGIGALALAARGAVKLRANAGGALRPAQVERTADLPFTPLQKRAARNVVSFESEDAAVTVHQHAIRVRDG